MSCNLYRSALMEAARGGQSAREATGHAATCEACQAFVAAQERLTRAARSVAAEAAIVTLPEGLESELLAEFDAVRSTGQRPRWYWMTAAGLALAASVVAGVLLVRVPWGLTGAPEAATQPAAMAKTPEAGTPAELKTVVAAVTLPPGPGRPEPQKPAPKPTTRLQAAEEPEAAFVSIPYTLPLAPDERANVVRMEVPVAALIAAGLPMRVQDMSANASADVLVGEDGRARAVRLISVSDSTFYRSYK